MMETIAIKDNRERNRSFEFPVSVRGFLKIMQFLGNVNGKNTYVEQNFGPGPPYGVKTLLGPH